MHIKLLQCPCLKSNRHFFRFSRRQSDVRRSVASTLLRPVRRRRPDLSATRVAVCDGKSEAGRASNRRLPGTLHLQAGQEEQNDDLLEGKKNALDVKAAFTRAIA